MAISTYRTPVKLIWAVLFTMSLVVPALSLAQQTEATGAPSMDDLEIRDCAVIQDGIKRLACYDAINNPQEAREASKETERQAIEETTEALEYEALTNSRSDEEAAAQLSKENRDGDGNNGIMSAVVDRYIAAEKAISSYAGSFVSHRPMYILPVTWTDSPNKVPHSPAFGSAPYGYNVKDIEAKYQISFKVPLLTGLLDDRTTLWFGYTQVSFWQVYNTEESAPFRETNYEPEIFLRYQTDFDIGPGTLNGVTVGLNHESNGQSDPRSRSWNRIMGSAIYSYDRWLFMVQPWYRLPESGSDDDNPDIERYLGHANYRAIYKLTEDRTISLMFRNNLRSENNKTSVELGYSFPMGETIKGFVQYYNGYGESLIDYNERIQRIGVGIMLNDWL